MLTVDLGAFVRAWAVEPRRSAWFLGAGASAAAGIPTAKSIVNDLLVTLYASETGQVRQSLDVTDPLVMERVRRHYDGAHGIAPLGSAQDYSSVFEAAIQTPDARRQYIRDICRDRQPSYGQRVLGAIVEAGAAHVLITTNFDDLLERAVADARAANGGTSPLMSVAAIDSSARAGVALADGDWPLLIKLHGDFREVTLKNLAAELQQQDEVLRLALSDVSRRFGLVVAGYSGRDKSVMDALRAASEVPNAWPGGLWWLTRDPRSVPAGVRELLESVGSTGSDAGLVGVENFDEAMSAIGRQLTLPRPLRTYVDGLRPSSRLGEARLELRERAAYPLLRFNAVAVTRAPSAALRHALGAPKKRSEIRTRLRMENWNGIAVAGPGDVVGFGDGTSLGAALGEPRPSERVDVDFTDGLCPHHMHALLVSGIAQALAFRLAPQSAADRLGGTSVVLGDGVPNFAPELDTAYESDLNGVLPASLGLTSDGRARRYAEGVRLSLEHRLGGLWLVFLPFTWVERSADQEAARRLSRSLRPADPAAPWRAERWAQRRRNDVWTKLVSAWSAAIAPAHERSLELLSSREPSGDWVSGHVEFGARTAYAREML